MDADAAALLVSTGPALTFDEVYEAWFEPCLRWLRAIGVPDADLDDLAQEVFLVVQRKLPRFDGANLPGWLYRITARTASDHRRRAWFRHLWRGGRVDPAELVDDNAGPAELHERREAAQRLDRILQRMNEQRRVALVLFELEGYSGEEIARLLDLPLATVWTRLHRARKELLALVAATRRP